VGDVLSQSQIDELLNSFSAVGTKAFENIETNESEKKIKAYDFKMPKKFTKEQFKIINDIYEIYSRLLSSYLTGITRFYCHVKVLQIEEQRYYEFNNALEDYVVMGTVNFGTEDEDVMDTKCILQLSNTVTFSLIDRLLGGYGSYTNISRDFTEIEVGLMKNILEKMTALLREAWEPYLEIDPALIAIETNSRTSQAIGPDDVIVLVTLEFECNNIKNVITISIPAVNMEVIMSKFNDRYSRNTKRFDSSRENERRDEILNGIKNSVVKMDIILAETQIDLNEILTLQVDDIIPLDIPITQNAFV
jgi:flagellar motor switch protein FliM